MHVWDGLGIVADRKPNGLLFARYLRGLGLIARELDGKLQYYLHNSHGDVVQMADQWGNVLRSYGYDAFGVEKAPEKLDSNPFRYCSEYFDSETETIYLRARYYAPRTGRFGTEDPIRAGGNWYSYCGNNPIAFVDPLGLEEVTLEGTDAYVALLNKALQDYEGNWYKGLPGKYFGNVIGRGLANEIWDAVTDIWGFNKGVFDAGMRFAEEAQKYGAVYQGAKVVVTYQDYSNPYFAAFANKRYINNIEFLTPSANTFTIPEWLIRAVSSTVNNIQNYIQNATNASPSVGGLSSSAQTSGGGLGATCYYPSRPGTLIVTPISGGAASANSSEGNAPRIRVGDEWMEPAEAARYRGTGGYKYNGGFYSDEMDATPQVNLDNLKR